MIKRMQGIVWPTISLLALLAFVAAALWRASAAGVCCADDALYAGVAKNLADGLGYTTTLPVADPRFFAKPFDPHVGSGPTIILPTAVLIKLLGNTHWVPGLSVVMLWTCLLLLIGWLLRKYSSGAGLAAATIVFLALSFATPWYYVAWYVLLGEVPAALLLILGAFLYVHSDAPQYRIAAGLAFALAVLAKPIALGALMAFVLASAGMWALRRDRTAGPGRRPILHEAETVGLGFVLPLGMFEAWKFIVLRPTRYLERLKASVEFFFGWGLQPGRTASPLQVLIERVDILRQNFAIWLPGVVVVLLVVWFIIRAEPDLRKLYLVFVTAIASFTAWWIFLSIGWQRYYIVPLILTYALFIFPFLKRDLSVGLAALHFFLLLAWTSQFAPNLRFVVSEMRTGFARERADTESLLEVSGMLEQAVARGDTLVAQSWSSAVDLEYIMDTHLNFTSFQDPAAYRHKPFLIAINTRWGVERDPDLAAVLAKCGRRQEIGWYLIAECPKLGR